MDHQSCDLRSITTHRMTMYILDLCSLRDLLNPCPPLCCRIPTFIFILSFLLRRTNNGGQSTATACLCVICFL